MEVVFELIELPVFVFSHRSSVLHFFISDLSLRLLLFESFQKFTQLFYVFYVFLCVVVELSVFFENFAQLRPQLHVFFLHLGNRRSVSITLPLKLEILLLCLDISVDVHLFESFRRTFDCRKTFPFQTSLSGESRKLTGRGTI